MSVFLTGLGNNLREQQIIVNGNAEVPKRPYSIDCFMANESLIDFERYERIRAALTAGDVDSALGLFEGAVTGAPESGQVIDQRSVTVALYMMQSILTEFELLEESEQLPHRLDSRLKLQSVNRKGFSKKEAKQSVQYNYHCGGK